MKFCQRSQKIFGVPWSCGMATGPARGDEGMWLFNDLPTNI